MKRFVPTRRQFLATSAMAGAATFVTPLMRHAVAANGDTLTVRLNGDIASLDPGYNIGGHPESDIIYGLFPSLVNYIQEDGELNWRPSVYMEHIEWTDPTHIDFTLKPGFMWTNGFGELTAEDVAYSFDRMKVSEWKGYFEAYEKLEIRDSYSGTIVLNSPFSPFMLTSLCAQTGAIMSQKATESVGGRYTTDIPASCSPYLLEWRQQQQVKLVPNPEWTGPQPTFTTVVGLVVDEHQAAALAYEAGELDATILSPVTYARYKESLPPDSAITIAGALNYQWLGMNTEHPKLQDIRVRKAIQHAIDVDAILQGAYGGTALASHGIVSPGLIGERRETKYSYDPEKSKALLAEAGVSGLELELKVLNEQERMLGGQIIQAQLAAVGIDVTVLPQDGGPFWEMGQETAGDGWKDLQIWTMRYSSAPDAYDPFQWFKRDQVGIWNWERWSDDEFETLFQEGIVETDPSRREEIYLRMQEIMEDTGAYVWISHEVEAFIHRDDLRIDVSPTGEMQFRYFEKV
jgi:peptide/nickel transport system substrate-binding protein